MSDQQAHLIQSLMTITGCSHEEGKTILEANNWDVEVAAATYLTLQDFQQNKPTQPVNTAKPATTSSAKPSQSRSGGVRGLSDYREKEDDDEENMNWFTGGEKSGLQVQAPKKQSDVEGIMKKAQEMGAKPAYEVEDPDKVPFSGEGYRLGATSGASQKVASNVKKQIRKKITFWKNGFSVDDEPARDYKDPQSQNLLNSIEKGQIPAEWMELGQDPLVDLIDRRGEDYKAPPKVIKPFSGGGQKLGSTSTTTTTSAPAPVSSTPAKKIDVDQSKPTTSIQIRLADGSRQVGTFNHTHTIRDIRSFIEGLSPSNFAYDLMTSFPQKVLADESQTIQDAGLVNSVVIQKRK